MSSRKFKAVLAGCGRIGSEFADDPRAPGIYSHAGAYAACPETELAAVCDQDENRLNRCADRWKVGRRYVCFDALLANEKPDIVSICTPDSTHEKLIEQALDAPSVKAILAEKPLATSAEAARRIVGRAQERGVVLAVNYSRRFAPGHAELKKRLEAGAIGAVRHVTGYYTKGLLHNGTHWLDLARWLVGEVVEVTGRKTLQEDSADPTLSAWLTFDGGAEACLHGCDASRFTLFEMDIVGDDGRVRLVDSGHSLEIDQVADSPHASGYRTLKRTEVLDGGLRDILLHAVRDVVRCLKDGGRPLCSGEDGVRVLQIAEAIRSSSSSGLPVPLAGL